MINGGIVSNLIIYIREILAKIMCKIGIHLMYEVKSRSSFYYVPVNIGCECVYCGKNFEFKSKYVKYWNRKMISNLLNKKMNHFD